MNSPKHPHVLESYRRAPILSKEKMSQYAQELLSPLIKDAYLMQIQDNQVLFDSPAGRLTVYFDWIDKRAYAFLNGIWHEMYWR